MTTGSGLLADAHRPPDVDPDDPISSPELRRERLLKSEIGDSDLVKNVFLLSDPIKENTGSGFAARVIGRIVLSLMQVPSKVRGNTIRNW